MNKQINKYNMHMFIYIIREAKLKQEWIRCSSAQPWSSGKVVECWAILGPQAINLLAIHRGQHWTENGWSWAILGYWIPQISIAGCWNSGFPFCNVPFWAFLDVSENIRQKSLPLSKLRTLKAFFAWDTVVHSEFPITIHENPSKATSLRSNVNWMTSQLKNWKSVDIIYNYIFKPLQPPTRNHPIKYHVLPNLSTSKQRWRVLFIITSHPA